MNVIKEFCEGKGITTAYRFWKVTGLTQSTAYRLWRNPDNFPDKASIEKICECLDCQPGDFLVYKKSS